MTSGHAPTAMLARYAAGTLPPGLRLLVASHLAFCACCRDKADRLVALGGALLAEADPVAPTASCLAKALARIAAPPSASSRAALSRQQAQKARWLPTSSRRPGGSVPAA